MTDEDLFSEEYASADRTTTDKDAVKEEPLGEQIEAEVSRYGTGKPMRITVRAQITHD